jgi:hypothetical protein
VDDQATCAFLTKLPAELRNEVYAYVFSRSTSGDRYREALDWQEKMETEGRTDAEHNENPPTPPHPLTLLLTCRKINSEATLLAFRTHTFTPRHALSSYRFRQQTSVLSTHQINAITRLALSWEFQHMSHTLCEHVCAKFIIHTVSILPSLRIIELCVRQRRAGKGSRGVPMWFVCTLNMAVNGREYVWRRENVWRKNEGWTWEMEDGSEDRAILTQEESGRKVEVAIAYISDVDCGFVKEGDVQLVPGTAHALPVESVTTRSGMQGLEYEPGEEYWERLRQKQEGKHGHGKSVNLTEMTGMAWWGSKMKVALTGLWWR